MFTLGLRAGNVVHRPYIPAIQVSNARVGFFESGDFAALAKKHSSCPSGKSGGDLGEFGPGRMVPEFDKVVFTAPVGAVQGPVKTQFGWHLLEVTSRTD